MNKTDLTQRVAEATGQSRNTVAEVLEAAWKQIQKAVIDGDKVSLVGVGTFDLARKSARTARNPNTGDPVEVPEKWVPKFTPAAWWGEAATAKQQDGAA